MLDAETLCTIFRPTLLTLGGRKPPGGNDYSTGGADENKICVAAGEILLDNDEREGERASATCGTLVALA